MAKYHSSSGTPKEFQLQDPSKPLPKNKANPGAKRAIPQPGGQSELVPTWDKHGSGWHWLTRERAPESPHNSFCDLDCGCSWKVKDWVVLRPANLRYHTTPGQESLPAPLKSRRWGALHVSDHLNLTQMRCDYVLYSKFATGFDHSLNCISIKANKSNCEEAIV